MSDNSAYYIVAIEWLYPTESGRDLYYDYDSHEEAIETCRKLCETELGNFRKVCGDATNPEMTYDPKLSSSTGYIISAKNGLDEWFYAARIIKVDKIEYGSFICDTIGYKKINRNKLADGRPEKV